MTRLDRVVATVGVAGCVLQLVLCVVGVVMLARGCS